MSNSLEELYIILTDKYEEFMDIKWYELENVEELAGQVLANPAISFEAKECFAASFKLKVTKEWAFEHLTPENLSLFLRSTNLTEELLPFLLRNPNVPLIILTQICSVNSHHPAHVVNQMIAQLPDHLTNGYVLSTLLADLDYYKLDRDVVIERANRFLGLDEPLPVDWLIKLLFPVYTPVPVN